MPVAIRGRLLGVERNGVFTSANTDLIPAGKLWTEAALTWNAMVEAYIEDGGSVALAVPAGPASSARSIPQQEFFWRNQPPPAAFPGTSNHGWAIAVDARFRQFVAWMHRNAHRYGWSHDEGARVGEWWHWRYIGASKRMLRRLRRKARRWDGFTTSERRWITEYDRLLAQGRDLKRRRVLRRVMAAQRKRVWRAAQEDGWTPTRKRRYRALKARST